MWWSDCQMERQLLSSRGEVDALKGSVGMLQSMYNTVSAETQVLREQTQRAQKVGGGSVCTSYCWCYPRV
jgi:hypothetical protein